MKQLKLLKPNIIWPKTVIILALSLGISLGLLVSLEKQENKLLETGLQLYLNGEPIQLEIADSPEKQYQGLSDRPELCSQCGMLFPYAAPRSLTFVMRRMKFPLDIVWIKDNTVIGVSKNLPPEQREPYTLYPSPGLADTVLELNGGQADFYKLQVGQKLTFSL